MTYTETVIPGVWIIEPKVLKDARGYFMEAFKQAEFEEHIGKIQFVQDNESCSSKGVLRGLHYQLHICRMWASLHVRLRLHPIPVL